MAIAREGFANLGLQNGVNPYVSSYTVGSGSNRILFVGFMGRGTDIVTGATYNGVAMTQLESNVADRFIYLFMLVNPDSGTHDVSISGTGPFDAAFSMAADYTESAQSGQPDDSDNASVAASSISNSVTASQAGDWAVALAREDIGLSGSWTAGLTALVDSGGLHWADSNGTISVGANTLTFSISPSSTAMAMVSAAFKVVGGGVSGFLLVKN